MIAMLLVWRLSFLRPSRGARTEHLTQVNVASERTRHRTSWDDATQVSLFKVSEIASLGGRDAKPLENSDIDVKIHVSATARLARGDAR